MTTALDSTSGSITVPGVTPGEVYALVSDVTRTGEWSPENVGGKWVGGASGPQVGARFVGSNKQGRVRWSTYCRVTDADPGQRFAFEVTAYGMPISRWQYDLDAEGDGTNVSLSWTDRRGGVRGTLIKVGGRLLTGVNRNAAIIDKNIAKSLARIRDVLTGAAAHR